MNAAPVPPVPVLDAGRIARLRDVLAGGHLALDADQRLAASILERWPGAAGLVTGANDFHRRAAAWAVGGGSPDFRVPPAAGVIFAGSGYPLLPGGLHSGASAGRPDVLFAYASADPASAAFSHALLAVPDPGRVSAYEASARDPAGLLGAPEALEILGRGPVMVQLQLCAQWWPADFAAWAISEYARLLPSGSTLALSLGVPGGGDAAEFLASVSRAGGRLHLHGEDQVAGWLAAAGLVLSPEGITDVRGREMGWASAEFARQRPVMRVVEAVALVP